MNARASLYLDSSAIVKLVVDELEVGPLRREVSLAGTLVTSRIAHIEATRAVERRLPAARSALDAALAGMSTIELDETIASRAATIGPPTLRTLDAIHVASALELLGELDGFITYDVHQAAAAAALGLPVRSPGA